VHYILSRDASSFCFKMWALFELHLVSFRHVLVITIVTWETHFNNKRKTLLACSFIFRSLRGCLRHIIFFCLQLSVCQHLKPLNHIRFMTTQIIKNVGIAQK